MKKSIPQRMCVACRSSATKYTLIRLVRTGDNRIQIDVTGARHGRGAYLCHNPSCWRAAVKRHSLERALRVEQLHPEDRDMLVQFAQGLERTKIN